MINLKKSQTAIEIASFGQNNLFISHNHERELELLVHDHMAHVVKIDTLTGHEEMG